MKNYSAQLVLLSTAILIVFAAINWVVDPYWIYDTPEFEHFNARKPLVVTNMRIFKISKLLSTKPEVLIIGSSREFSGIDPKHPCFGKARVFNAAIPAQPYTESKAILNSLFLKNAIPKQVVFGMLFENSQIGKSVPVDYSLDNFLPTQKYKLLVSLSTLESSLKTIGRNLVGSNSYIEKNGFATAERMAELNGSSQRRYFTESEKGYLSDQPCNFTLTDNFDNSSSPTPMQELRKAVETVYRMKSDMKIIIGPSHARQWEIIQVGKHWEQFENWKRMIVKIIESEAIKAHATPFQVWDFSGYNSITNEDIPSATDKIKRMRYYYESSHYTPAAGDLVLDRIFNYHAPDRNVPEDFGVLLTSKNIEAHLVSIRAAREQYRLTHPEDIAEIEAMAQEVTKAKHCR